MGPRQARQVRLVLDTNVVASRHMSPSGAPARLIDRWERGAFEIVVSLAILDEYRRALGYERVRSRHGMTNEEIELVVDLFRDRGVVVAPQPLSAPVSVDPDDDEILACAVAGNASYIVTGDRDLLRLGEYAGVLIVTPAEMLAILDAPG